MMSTGSLESVYSIWELKAPPPLPIDSDRTEELVCSESYKRSVRVLFADSTYVGQIIQQAQCAFDEYEHQSKMHVFLVAGYWAQLLVMRRDNMPSKDFDYQHATKNDLAKFVTRSPKKMFQLLNPQKPDYSNEFKQAWARATTSVEEGLKDLDE